MIILRLDLRQKVGRPPQRIDERAALVPEARIREWDRAGAAASAMSGLTPEKCGGPIPLADKARPRVRDVMPPLVLP